MPVKITDYISITDDKRQGIKDGYAQIIVYVPRSDDERQAVAENLATILREYPHMNRSVAIRAAIAEMAERIRKGETEQ